MVPDANDFRAVQKPGENAWVHAGLKRDAIGRLPVQLDGCAEAVRNSDVHAPNVRHAAVALNRMLM